jgi:hypothetical protein
LREAAAAKAAAEAKTPAPTIDKVAPIFSRERKTPR